MVDEDLERFLELLFPDPDPWPKPLHLIRGWRRVRAGEAPADVARSVGTTVSTLSKIAADSSPLLTALQRSTSEATPQHCDKVRRMLGGLLLGKAAEIAFEEIYKKEMGSSEFELVDLREGRTDTDYRLLNGGKRPIYRINIKFFGSIFRRAPELVDLQEQDCFPLATYKIYQALQKQVAEHLPYLFVVVGVPGLTSDSLAPIIENSMVEPLASLTASKRTPKRKLEDRTVDLIVRAGSPAYRAAYDSIRSAEWFVMSARRADMLLREKLFDRVYALRIRGFAQQFRGAELDMHFSLSNDLLALNQFFEILRTEGQTKTASMLERGAI